MISFKGDIGRTWVACWYNPCYNKHPDSSTTYQLNCRFFFTKKKDLTCPQTKFSEDLVSQLKKWPEEGDRLIVCLDANGDIYKKLLGKALTNIDGLSRKEMVGEFTCTHVGMTFFWGSKPIDGVWATSDITVYYASIMPAGYGIGDHQHFVIDFASRDIIGNTPPKVVRAPSRRLNTKIPHPSSSGICKNPWKKYINHRLIERVGEAHTLCRSKNSITWHLNQLDKELGW
jgi:hypothetical protein